MQKKIKKKTNFYRCLNLKIAQWPKNLCLNINDDN
jgi:hypothetical protein